MIPWSSPTGRAHRRCRGKRARSIECGPTKAQWEFSLANGNGEFIECFTAKGPFDETDCQLVPCCRKVRSFRFDKRRNPTCLPLVRGHLIERGTLTAELAKQLEQFVAERKNMLICGATASRKTTLANILMQSIPDHERIVLIEDIA